MSTSMTISDAGGPRLKGRRGGVAAGLTLAASAAAAARADAGSADIASAAPTGAAMSLPAVLGATSPAVWVGAIGLAAVVVGAGVWLLLRRASAPSDADDVAPVAAPREAARPEIVLGKALAPAAT